jgi:hypothetical protein
MKAIFCALLFFVTANVCADTMTVGDLQQICTDASAESKSACKFYILGVAQGIRLGRAWLTERQTVADSACPMTYQVRDWLF